MPELRCRVCKKLTRPGEEFFPFCSKRCKMVDLGAWVDERYRICGFPLLPPEEAARSVRKDDIDPEATGDLPAASPAPEDAPR